MTRISWVNGALGVWLVIAAFALPHASGAAITEDVVAGSLVALASVWAARAYRPTVSLIASWTVALTGLWILCAPFVLGYERARPAVIDEIVVGVAIAALAVVNTRHKAAVVDNR
jgi:uncharacterized membrane protein YGL010W